MKATELKTTGRGQTRRRRGTETRRGNSRTPVYLFPRLGVLTGEGRKSQGAFTLVEIMMVLVMAAIMILAGLSTVSLLDRSSRRQALHTSAMELAQGKIEEFRAIMYNPPVPPYTNVVYTSTTNVTLLLDKTGSSNWVTGVMTTTTAQSGTLGHMVTVKIAATNAGQALVVQLQTLVNRNSGGQP